MHDSLVFSILSDTLLFGKLRTWSHDSGCSQVGGGPALGLSILRRSPGVLDCPPRRPWSGGAALSQRGHLGSSDPSSLGLVL